MNIQRRVLIQGVHLEASLVEIWQPSLLSLAARRVGKDLQAHAFLLTDDGSGPDHSL